MSESMSETMSETMSESMPCPRCGKQHMLGKYIPRPDLKKDDRSGIPHAPPDVDCDCGAKLRQQVPLFAVGKYGWQWKIL